MPEEQQKLDVDEIIEKAFDYFDRFVNRSNNLNEVLLEGLEPLDDGWIVSIGFNGRRQESSEPAVSTSFSAIAGFANRTTKNVREVRHIYLDNNGIFMKMD